MEGGDKREGGEGWLAVTEEVNGLLEAEGEKWGHE